jgi:hypothetical protein
VREAELCQQNPILLVDRVNRYLRKESSKSKKGQITAIEERRVRPTEGAGNEAEKRVGEDFQLELYPLYRHFAGADPTSLVMGNSTSLGNSISSQSCEGHLIQPCEGIFCAQPCGGHFLPAFTGSVSVATANT